MVKAKSILLAVNVPLWTTVVWTVIQTVFISVSDAIEYESFCLLEITPDFVGFFAYVFCFLQGWFFLKVTVKVTR